MNADHKRITWTRSYTQGLTLTLPGDPPEPVTSAAWSGGAAGPALVERAASAAAAAVREPAGKAVAQHTAATAEQARAAGRVADLERERSRAPVVVWGSALDARLAELADELAAVNEIDLTAGVEVRAAVRELNEIGGRAVSDVTRTVSGAIRERRSELTRLRDRAEQALRAALAEHLSAYLRAAAELAALAVADPAAAARQALRDAVPEAFGPGGLAAVEDPPAPDPEEETQHVAPVDYEGRARDYREDRDDQQRDEVRTAWRTLPGPGRPGPNELND